MTDLNNIPYFYKDNSTLNHISLAINKI